MAELTPAQEFGLSGSALGAGSAILSIMGGVQARSQARANARLTRQIGAMNEAEMRRESMRLLGAQVAARGAQGVTLSGSALDVLLDTAATEERRAQRLRFTVEAEAYAQRARGELALQSSIMQGIGQLGQTMSSLGDLFTPTPVQRTGYAPTQFQHHAEGWSEVLGPGGWLEE